MHTVIVPVCLGLVSIPPGLGSLLTQALTYTLPHYQNDPYNDPKDAYNSFGVCVLLLFVVHV
jgi:hypothetical protein